jgi:hypothetical protein
MLIELCASNYATFDGLVNGIDDIFKPSTTYNNKIIISIMFQNFKIGILIRKKFNHYYNDNIESKWTIMEPITKNIRLDKTQSFFIYNKDSISNSTCNKKNYPSFPRIITK